MSLPLRQEAIHTFDLHLHGKHFQFRLVFSWWYRGVSSAWPCFFCCKMIRFCTFVFELDVRVVCAYCKWNYSLRWIFMVVVFTHIMPFLCIKNASIMIILWNKWFHPQTVWRGGVRLRRSRSRFYEISKSHRSFPSVFLKLWSVGLFRWSSSESPAVLDVIYFSWTWFHWCFSYVFQFGVPKERPEGQMRPSGQFLLVLRLLAELSHITRNGAFLLRVLLNCF